MIFCHIFVYILLFAHPIHSEVDRLKDSVHQNIPRRKQERYQEPPRTWNRKQLYLFHHHSASSQIQNIRPTDEIQLEGNLWQFTSIPGLQTPILHAPHPTFGMAWPLPSWWTTTVKFFPIDIDNLQFKQIGAVSDVVNAAIKRYHNLILSRIGLSVYTIQWSHQEPLLKKMARKYMEMDSKTPYSQGTGGATEAYAERARSSWSADIGNWIYEKFGDKSREKGKEALSTVNVHVRSVGTDWPHLGMDESYVIHVENDGIYLLANQTWGALRGLETLSQIMWRTLDMKQVYINQTHIRDSPRFTHRGLMMDTSRHFINKSVIFLNLEAMAFNKMSVFHWHIVDDNSFPYMSEAFPDLAQKGAYHSRQWYTAEDIREILEFARYRGIRVIPEFDIPGHTRSLAYSKPELLAQCKDDDTVYFGPLNTFNNETYSYLKALFHEISNLFTDDFLHLGGDEVETVCWDSDPKMSETRNALGLSADLPHEFFWRRVFNSLSQSKKSKQMTPVKRRSVIVWQDVMQHVSEYHPSTVMHVWKPDNAANIPFAGNIIYSACWYLDLLHDIRNWFSYYTCDPLQNLGFSQDSRSSMVLGGEACMWTEYQSDDTITQKIWPVTSTVAERLWSPYWVNNVGSVGPRLEEQRCRMISRGIPQSVILGPGTCSIPSTIALENPIASIVKQNLAVGCNSAQGGLPISDSQMNPIYPFFAGIIFGIFAVMILLNWNRNPLKQYLFTTRRHKVVRLLVASFGLCLIPMLYVLMAPLV